MTQIDFQMAATRIGLSRVGERVQIVVGGHLSASLDVSELRELASGLTVLAAEIAAEPNYDRVCDAVYPGED